MCRVGQEQRPRSALQYGVVAMCVTDLTGRVRGPWFVVCRFAYGLDRWVCSRTDRVNCSATLSGKRLRRMRKGGSA
jgi:hypothetical protein